MDLVIKRLSSIEEASAGIIEAAENEKKALEQQMRERIQAFDEEAEKLPVHRYGRSMVKKSKGYTKPGNFPLSAARK